MHDYIDLTIIESKLSEGLYNGTFSFLADIRMIFDKAVRYMVNDKEATHKAMELSKYFETMAKELENLPFEANTAMDNGLAGI